MQALLELLHIEPCIPHNPAHGEGDRVVLAQCFPQAEVIGVDLDSRCVSRCRSWSAGLGLTNVTFEMGHLVTMQFAQSFDLIVAIDVL